MLFLFFFIKTFIIRKDAGKKNSTGPIFFAVPSHYLLVMLWSKLSWTFDVGTMKLWPLKNSSRGRKGWKDHWYAKFKLSITIWVEMYFDGICCILFSKHTGLRGKLSIYYPECGRQHSAVFFPFLTSWKSFCVLFEGGLLCCCFALSFFGFYFACFYITWWHGVLGLCWDFLVVGFWYFFCLVGWFRLIFFFFFLSWGRV